jgi:hypothetical protein
MLQCEMQEPCLFQPEIGHSINNFRKAADI